MRRFVVFVGPLLAAALAFACEDDPSGTPTNQFPEAGAFDSSRPTSDSSLPDAGQPQPDVVVPPQPVTVVATSVVGGAVADVTVVFHDANGAVLETKKTGADGKATSSANPAIAMATAAFGQGKPWRELLTWTGVQGGDVLPVVMPSYDTLAQVDITVPGQFTDAGGPTFNYYARVGGCGKYFTDPNALMTVYLDPSCFTGAGAVLVSGADNNDVIVAHALKKPVTLPADGGVAAVTTDAWKFPPTNVTVSVTNTNDTSGVAWFQQIANQTAFPEGNNLGDTYQASFRAVSGSFVEAYNASVAFAGAQGSRVLGKRVAPTATITFDAAQLPPAISGASVDSTTKKRPAMAWTGNMAAMKGGLVRATWFDPQTEHTTHWTLVVPANNAATGTATAPSLPAALDDMLPLADGGAGAWETTPEVTFVESDLLPDYASWRKIQGVILPWSIAGAGVERAVLPQNGNFKLTHFNPPSF